jgi:hypothetical protein
MQQTELAVLDIGESQEQVDGSTNPKQAGGLGVMAFKSFLQECRWQPPWRNMADKCADYYDGNQLDQETLQALDGKGMGPLQRNIIQPLINVVLGMEAKTRTDWRVSADSDALQDVAEALSAKLHEAERESRADRACSDGYAGQIKAGLSWVEVSRSSDPFDYPYRCSHVHRREIFWDWRDESPDLRKARFLLRKRWFDVDQVIAYFPEEAELLRSAVGDPNRYEMLANKRSLDLGQSLEEDRGLDIEDYEQWRSFDRRRVALYEMWYRQFVRGLVAKLPNGEVIECDPKNPVHQALYSRRAIQPFSAIYSKLRMSLWCGPHRLMDEPSPRRELPYVPFWGYREDRTGVPYGLVRAMLVPQDEVNARLQKMMWLLGAKRVVMDSDALDQTVQSPQDMLAEIARPDAVVFLNANRTNRQGAFNVDDNLSVSDAQFKVLQDAMQSAQQVVGVFNATLGRPDSAGQSGQAINSLVEQGTTALAEINDNYRYARRLVGERLLERVREDLIGQRVDVMVGESGKRRVISLNRQVKLSPEHQQEMAQNGGRVPLDAPEAQAAQGATEDEQAIIHMQNDVRGAKVRVSLDDVPSSSAYREQQFTMLAELTKGLPPQLQAVITPFIMEASDLRNRRQIADVLRKALGQPHPRTPQEEQQLEQAQAQAQQFAQQVQQQDAILALKEREAKINKMNAEAQKALAEANEMASAGPTGGVDAGAHAERIAQVQDKYRAEIDRLTAQAMTARANYATREQRLLGELAKVTAALKANAGNSVVEHRRLDIEREIAQMEADVKRERAKAEEESQRVIQGLTDEIAALRDEFKAALEKERSKTDKAVARVEKKAERRATPKKRS